MFSENEKPMLKGSCMTIPCSEINDSDVIFDINMDDIEDPQYLTYQDHKRGELYEDFGMDTSRDYSSI